MPIEAATRGDLLRVARESIRRRLTGDASPPEPEVDDPVLHELRATFVTLMRRHTLRGCIGTLEAQRPLLLDVTHNARAAAFRDPRFSPLKPEELPGLVIEISVLTPSAPLPVRDRAELLQRLVPGRDGLTLEEGMHRATFLPAVWETLPDAEQFLAQLLHKARLPKDHWSDRLRFSTYTTESFAESDAA